MTLTYDEIMLLDEDGLNLAVAKAIALRGEVAARLTCMTDDAPGGEEMECQGEKTPEEIQYKIEHRWGYGLSLCYLYSYEDKEYWGVVPEWSTDIGEAWELLPSHKDGWYYDIYTDAFGPYCIIESDHPSSEGQMYFARGATAALAICRAVLIWKGNLA